MGLKYNITVLKVSCSAIYILGAVLAVQSCTGVRDVVVSLQARYLLFDSLSQDNNRTT
jgi:hypothetical protein